MPWPIASGTPASIAAAVVMRIGRKCIRHASRMSIPAIDVGWTKVLPTLTLISIRYSDTEQGPDSGSNNEHSRVRYAQLLTSAWIKNSAVSFAHVLWTKFNFQILSTTGSNVPNRNCQCDYLRPNRLKLSGENHDDRSACVGTSSGWHPIYTELLTCLEISRDVRKLHSETPSGRAPNSPRM